MNQKFKRTSFVALAAVAASVVNAALLAPSASAAENTWIRTTEEISGDHVCVSAINLELSPGRWAADARYCSDGARSQLWDRRGDNIKLIDTNQCLDSNEDGEVYYTECNGGSYQKWDYHSSGQVTNRATGRYLEARAWLEPDWFDYTLGTTSTPGSWGDAVSSNKWEFSGGQ
ncbi:ricin-type beta-trefoil lectin domain protein [Streptomyces sp. NA02950]|uniref:ricin-type beta-trefoil lectin domain protein n=1 Tax=Streptomyces sp. NA02950 TaxID=2742137 RepID=UPI0015906520|nr:ricin-type beta-trefoil lectin domain protein [Streptomyces sp. NA02950]QKV97211.1 ricin-type beta-trefoil lectin domain protein [Streptomyces sp. NA02950]